jgi:YD repeat-containing protein
MRGLLILSVLLVGLATANTASAATPLRNVTGFDPTLLAGKTCQGAFNTGKTHEASLGALQLRFAVKGDVLSAHLWRLLGQTAYDQAAYALTQPAQGIGVSWFDDLGEVRGLSVAGKAVRYVDSQGARVQLTYDQGRLRGQSDPRGQSIPGMTRLAFVTMICR